MSSWAVATEVRLSQMAQFLLRNNNCRGQRCPQPGPHLHLDKNNYNIRRLCLGVVNIHLPFFSTLISFLVPQPAQTHMHMHTLGIRRPPLPLLAVNSLSLAADISRDFGLVSDIHDERNQTSAKANRQKHLPQIMRK